MLAYGCFRRSVVVALGLVCCTALAAALRADGFLSRVEDLPLAPGLAEDFGAGFSFDSAGGRLVDAYARGDVSAESVLEFYAQTLPQLGWTIAGAAQYVRNGERLNLEIVRGADGIVVHYSLSPQ
jgi:hypothetical protein